MDILKGSQVVTSDIFSHNNYISGAKSRQPMSLAETDVELMSAFK